MTAVAGAPAPLQRCVQLAGKDLRAEARAGEALLVTVPFGAVGLLLVPLAVGTDTPLLREIGPGLYWVVVLLFGVLVTLRASTVDGPAQLDLLRLCGVGPGTRLAGRALANTVLLLGVQALLGPVAVVLYDPDLSGWPWLAPAALLVAAGLGVLGALADALAQGLASRTTLGPLLVAPLAVPLLLGATQLLTAARYHRPAWPWLTLMLTADLLTVLAAALCAAHLEEAR